MFWEHANVDQSTADFSDRVNSFPINSQRVTGLFFKCIDPIQGHDVLERSLKRIQVAGFKDPAADAVANQLAGSTDNIARDDCQPRRHGFLDHNRPWLDFARQHEGITTMVGQGQIVAFEKTGPNELVPEGLGYTS